MPASIRMIVRRLFSLIVLTALTAGPLIPAGAQDSRSGPSFPSQQFEKVILDAGDAAGLGRLAALGAERLVDYGAFSLWRISVSQAATLAQVPGVARRPDFDTIPLRGAVIDTRPGAAPLSVTPALSQLRAAGPQFWLVQFIGPIHDDWLTQLAGLGLQTVSYMPHNAYVVWGDSASLTQLEAWAAKGSVVQWTGAYHPAYRLAPSLHTPAASPAPGQLVDVTVQFYTTGSVHTSLARLLALGGQVHKRPEQILSFTNVTLQLPAGQLADLAGWPDVFNVEPWSAPVLLDEIQNQILAGNVISSGGKIVPSGPGYLAWLASKGFPTTASSYPIIDIVDDGIDDGSTNPLHPDFHTLGVLTATSRLIYNTDCTDDPAADGEGGHGNINAGIVGSYNNLTGSPHEDANGYRIGLGMSPYGRLGGTKIFKNAGNYNISACGSTDQGVVLASYNAGAGITSNSWGYDVFGAYDAVAQAYDALTRDAASAVAGNQEMLHIVAAGNSGSGANTIGSPATAKNVLTVGATENVRDNGIVDGCGLSAADSADDIAAFSSRGPTDDSRVKPDIMAPGTHVQGPASQDAGYDGDGVCGASPAPNLYYPLGQTLYTWSSGTSHSTPAVAGAASLVYEYYGRVLDPGETPSPAMLKALLVNTPRYLDGSGTGGTLPNNNQGWGDVNLGALFDGNPRALVDQTVVLRATGEVYTETGYVISTTLPFHVSLVWTDAPGATTGNAYVNDLNLQVTLDGTTYKGNVFNGANSISGGSFDARNNIENVFVPAGVSGDFVVEVIAANIAGDGVPGNGDLTDQDFALVITNGFANPQAVLAAGTVSVSDAAGNNDGVVDPGETIELHIALDNAGTATATNVSGVLTVTTGSATLTNAVSPYPNMAPDSGAGNTTPFVVAVSGSQPCGQPLSFAFTVTYDAPRTVDLAIDVPVGVPVIAFSEDFDGVTAPALPAGWTAAVLAGIPAPWQTVTTTVDTAPNAAFAPDISTVSDNVLLTPPFTVTTTAAQLSFRNSYNLEAGYDGGVLEIKIGAGAFQDILAAGGSFVTGGYKQTISASYGNPLGGRMAWTGNSGVYKDTLVNLPAAAAGQSVQLRWRVGTDSSFAATGQWIDSLTLLDKVCSAPPGLEVAATSVSDAAGNGDGILDPGETIAIDISVVNNGKAAATGISGTLSVASGLGSMVSDTSAYPDLDVTETATNTTPYQVALSASHKCGDPLELVLDLTHNLTRTLALNLSLATGMFGSFEEDFDGVTAPALPAGWTATVLAGSVNPWRTVTTTVDSAPNAVFAPAHATASNSVLVSPVFTGLTAASQLTFRNRYEHENGWDGARLEISIAGGSFTDILAAGGTFASGGYNASFSSGGGGAGWTANSGGYITTTVNLPDTVVGQSVQIRWRVSSDTSTAATGQWIDSVVIDNANLCSGVAAEPTVQFSSAAYSVGEAGSSGVVTVTLSAASAQTVMVNYATSNGTALAGSDYTAVSATLVFTPGITARTFVVPILNDMLVEGSETVTLTLSGAVSATLGAPNPATLTVLDDDMAGVALSPPSASATGGPGDVVTYTLQISNTGNISDTFDVAFTGGAFTATVPATLGPLAPGASTSLVVVVHIPLAAAGGTHSVSTLTLTSQANPSQTAAATLDTEVMSPAPALPVVAFSATNYTASEASPSATITATLSATSTQTVMVNYAASNGTALAGSDYTAVSGTLVFTPGITSATFVVPILDDSLVEGSETVILTLSNVLFATLGAPNPATLTLLDDDVASFKVYLPFIRR